MRRGRGGGGEKGQCGPGWLDFFFLGGGGLIYMGFQELAPISSKLIFILLTLYVSEIKLF